MQRLSGRRSTSSQRSANQQVMLFWHLGQVLSLLARHIPWQTFDPVQKRRLEATLEVLVQEGREAKRAAIINNQERRGEEDTAKAAAP